MSTTTAFIINHTHWDREWFLTSVYTSRWIPGLIEKLEALVAENPDFRYLFDGQTLVVEDLVALAPEYEARIQTLIQNGNLAVGPYYCQPDWQLTCGELLIRNLVYGQRDVAANGGDMKTGWMVDTFGHLSQSPQIHQLFDIDAIYVWRGVPKLEPYFDWQGADGSELFTVNLFGGYRNLYGVTHAPEIAVKRLTTEVGRLAPFYPTPDMPLFDGYDLEDNPEDPVRYYAEQPDFSDQVLVMESTPTSFAAKMAAELPERPVVHGEMNSGKYGAIFTGVASARTYLKVMAADCERMLFQVAEPLATLARLSGRPYNAEWYESVARLLLQNAVHDCICGVSIDQVHEKMEYGYRQSFAALVEDAQSSLDAIMDGFAAGEYAVNTTPFAVDQWQPAGDKLVHVQADGLGVWPITESTAIEHVNEIVPSFSWTNEHYAAELGADGLVVVNGTSLGSLVVSEELGDTYSEEIGERLGEIRVTSPLTVVERSAQHAAIAFDGEWRADERYANVAVHLAFDSSPLIRWTIDLDSRGTDLRVDMVFETGKTGPIHAGMPFDAVQRPAVDDDLLPRDLPDELAAVLLGQRELGVVSSFPFHDFVALSDDDDSKNGTVAVLSKGTRAYAVDEAGTLQLALRRSVEWLTKAGLKDRIGDAGPFFYVPDARCERTVRHEVAVSFGDFSGDSMQMQRINAAYQNPPLIVACEGNGEQTSRPLQREDLPLSSLQVNGDQVLARFYNPTSEAQPLTGSYTRTDVWGSPDDGATNVAPKQIVSVSLPLELPEETVANSDASWMNPPEFRVGDNQGMPDPAILEELAAGIAGLEAEIAELEPALDAAEGDERLRLLHRYYVLKRESIESQLSHVLNTRKMAECGKLRYGYLFEPDDEVAAIGLELNKLRIKRRIFDYVVTVI